VRITKLLQFYRYQSSITRIFYPSVSIQQRHRYLKKLMETLHRFYIWIVIFIMFCGGLASGCMPHLLTSDEQTPAQLLVYPGAPPVHDGRVRFRQIVCDLAGQLPSDANKSFDCTHLLWRMADEKAPPSPPQPLPSHNPHLHLLIVPGAFAECFPEFGMPFEDAASSLRQRGYRIDFIPVSGRSGADRNAARIAAAVEQLPDDPAERIVLIGHSKGAVDILHFLVNHPQPARRISAVVSVAGAVNGSPLADNFAETYRKVFSKMPFLYCRPGDRDVVNSLTRSYCMTWLSSHRLPQYVKYFSLGGFARRRDIHPMMLLTYDLLATVEPRNDGYLTFSDQVIPGATLLGYANLDHYDIALPVRERLNFGGINSHAVARELLFQAIVLTVVESLNSASKRPAL
jgi:pimeloyl-ACP methyl ester carboxylesterase